MSAAKKGKGKEKEKAPAASPAPTPAAAPATAVVPANSANPSEETKLAQRDLLEAMYGLNMRQSREAGKKEHKFWNTQPVPQSDETPSDHGPIEVKTVADVRAEPYALPDQFEWSDCDTGEDKTIDEVYNLLNQNYVEDDDNMFRFDYSRGFLQWALRPPGFLPQLHLGVRVKGTGKLVGFITGIPAHIRAYDKVNPMVEINFLCVHKKLRAKRLAPVLIKEITRRVNLTNVWQAVYTAGVVLPKPVGRTRYHHRSLNPKKLIDIGFSRLARNMTLARTIKLYKLPDAPQIPGIRALTVADVPAAYQLLHNYLKNFSLVQEFDEAEFAHWLLPRPGVVSCYVVEDPASKKLTDMVSFYCLPSTIIGNPNYSTLKAAYSFYNVSTKTPWVTLMTDALILAKQEDFDVFNALDLMENKNFFEPLKFGVGDGCLQYYLYNWRCPEMPAEKVGLVLL